MKRCCRYSTDFSTVELSKNHGHRRILRNIAVSVVVLSLTVYDPYQSVTAIADPVATSPEAALPGLAPTDGGGLRASPKRKGDKTTEEEQNPPNDKHLKSSRKRPTGTDKPKTPNEPETPRTPETPDTPDRPETPDIPETPDTPDRPETPDIPETPDTPDTPKEPETPTTGDNPPPIDPPLPPIEEPQPPLPPPTPTPVPEPECKNYSIQFWRWNSRGSLVYPPNIPPVERNWDPRIFVGEGANLSCLQQLLNECSSDGLKHPISDGGRMAGTDECVTNKLSERLLPGFDEERGVAIMDENCNPVPDPQRVNDEGLCGAIRVEDVRSPVSLLWDGDINDSLSLVQFPLDPYQAGKWFTWKASSAAPLVVYDPEHKGKIVSAAQLFGNFTFFSDDGFARTSLADRQTIKRWENGFQALESLDQNGDDKLTEKELEPLGLWFDHNRDGVSQDGEVQSLAQVGVVTLYVKPNRKDKHTQDLYVDVGFERVKDGMLITGTAVDWYGVGFTSKTEALSRLQRSSGSIEAEKGKENGTSSGIEKETIEAFTKKTSLSPSGTWFFGITGDEQYTRKFGPRGLLILEEKGGTLHGTSYTEGALEKNDRKLRSIISRAPLSGKATGEHLYEFEIVSESGLRTATTAKLSADGKILTGKSASQIGPNPLNNKVSTITYEWVAHRLQ